MRSVLVFVKRKVDADRLARAVARSGVNATSLHSNRSQAERTAALDAFRRGDCPVLVATDVAGRGLDISGISHVINFDVPRCSDDYIHRAGRTARAGATGQVITFIAPDEEALLGEIQAELGIALPHAALPDSIVRAERRAETAARQSGQRPPRPAPCRSWTVRTSRGRCGSGAGRNDVHARIRFPSRAAARALARCSVSEKPLQGSDNGRASRLACTVRLGRSLALPVCISRSANSM